MKLKVQMACLSLINLLYLSEQSFGQDARSDPGSSAWQQLGGAADHYTLPSRPTISLNPLATNGFGSADSLRLKITNFSLPGALDQRLPAGPDAVDISRSDAAIGGTLAAPDRNVTIQEQANSVLDQLTGLAQASVFASKWQRKFGKPMPAKMMDFFDNPTLKIPDFLPSDDVGRNTFISLHGPSQLEVEPDVASDRILKGYGNLETPTLVVNNLSTPSAKSSAADCGEAVRTLRREVSYGGISKNLIDGFSEICLFGGQKDDLTAQQMKLAKRCAETYNAYISSCFGTVADDITQTINEHVGVIYAFDTSQPQRQRILCSGAAITNARVLTAKHCLAGLSGLGANVRLGYIPMSMTTPAFAVKRLELSVAGGGWDAVQMGDLPRFLSGNPDLDDLDTDALVLVLDTENDPKSRIELAAPKDFDHVVLAGFQRLAVNAIQLKARLENKPIPYDHELIETGTWRQAFRFDGSPTCLVIHYTDTDAALFKLGKRSIGHFCQSLGNASGSALFKPADTSTPMEVVAVHSRALYQSDLPGGDVLESMRPKNAALAVDAPLRTAKVFDN
ncbi:MULTISPECIES: hypothetical protein [unclassified Mesorhizobium]|uniref:hypothetical protein n=1 Tax=unclassified Mesorhizobium TaxID=325217 RepID=UPI000BAF9409|nr:MULTISPECIES: hypothetical protein [unclassified Mesorhizobium]PBB22294.1 hypothetical protein CK232_34080 [Mesorhizobium sp. WSM4304]PBB70970.1 hypothetical protein CK227_34460 [Mesorhizobium sp. WSM4308]